ncbi:unnamed protein product [Prunus armeniaca]
MSSLGSQCKNNKLCIEMMMLLLFLQTGTPCYGYYSPVQVLVDCGGSSFSSGVLPKEKTGEFHEAFQNVIHSKSPHGLQHNSGSD